MSSLRVFEQNISSTNSGFGLRKKSTFVLSKTIQTFSYSQSHFGWHFRKLKAQSYNVSFPMSKWKEKFEFWPVLKQHSKMSPQVGMTVLYGKVERKKQTHECTVVESTNGRKKVDAKRPLSDQTGIRLTRRDHYQTKHQLLDLEKRILHERPRLLAHPFLPSFHTLPAPWIKGAFQQVTGVASRQRGTVGGACTRTT